MGQLFCYTVPLFLAFGIALMSALVMAEARLVLACKRLFHFLSLARARRKLYTQSLLSGDLSIHTQ